MIPLKNYRISNPYGVRNPQYYKGYHTGVDLTSNDHTIYAASHGTVLEAKWASGSGGADPGAWGNYIIVQSEDHEYEMIYAHMASLNVIVGQQVTEGMILGILGSTGQSTGPHLHFEVRKAPWKNENDIDPFQWLMMEGEKGFMELILVAQGPDERAAGYLADYLKAPVAYLNAVKPSDIAAAQTIYVVGGSYKPLERAILLAGGDRYATCQKVLDFIAKGGT